MYKWILAAGLLMAFGIAVRRFLQKRRGVRPRLQLGGDPRTDSIDAATPASELQHQLSSLAEGAASSQTDDAAESMMPAVTPGLRPIGPTSGVGSGAAVGSSAVDPLQAHGRLSGIAGKDSQNSEFAETSRLSTWQDRRLFPSFQGILNEGGTFLRTPQPEELPIADSDYVFGPLTPGLAQLLPETESRRQLQRRNLAAAGYRSRASWLNLTAIRFVLGFVSMVILGALLLVAPASMEIVLLSLVVTVPVVFWALPPLIVAMRAGERRIDIEHGLPDVLDMMNMGISQGLTVPQSIRRIAAEIRPVHPALSEELAIVNRQAEVGSMMQALKNFSNRIDTPEVHSFTSLLMQSEATGTSISQSLTDYSDSFRSSLKERADARANAAAFKLLFPVSLCLMPSVFLFLLGPAIVELSDFFNNRAEVLNTDRDNALDSMQRQTRQTFQTGQGGN